MYNLITTGYLYADAYTQRTAHKHINASFTLTLRSSQMAIQIVHTRVHTHRTNALWWMVNDPSPFICIKSDFNAQQSTHNLKPTAKLLSILFVQISIAISVLFEYCWMLLLIVPVMVTVNFEWCCLLGTMGWLMISGSGKSH